MPGQQVMPDIYYIILDAYGRSDVFADVYGFDNGDFIDALASLGFYVAPESRSNYMLTKLSIPSSLNMQHLNGLSWAEIRALPGMTSVENTYSGRIAAALGYKHQKAISTIEPDVDSSASERAKRIILSDFSAMLLNSTLARPSGIQRLWAKQGSEFFEANLRSLMDIPQDPDLTFTLAYSMPPRPPYIFDRDGRVRPKTSYLFRGNVWQKKDLYIDQLIYVNQVVEEVMRAILERSATEPIIIIQGDHGPSSEHDVRAPNPSDLAIFERIGILNAYYFPEYCRSSLYPTVTPVNSFRLAFDACLGTDLGLSPDTSYWSVDSGQIDQFTPIEP